MSLDYVARDLLLGLINLQVDHPDLKGGVAFLRGDAKTIKTKMLQVNALLTHEVDVPIWDSVVIGYDKDELYRMYKQFTDGQRECFDQRFGAPHEVDDDAVPRALIVARLVTKNNKYAESQIKALVY